MKTRKQLQVISKTLERSTQRIQSFLALDCLELSVPEEHKLDKLFDEVKLNYKTLKKSINR